MKMTVKTTRYSINLIVPVVVIMLSSVLAKAEILINLGTLDRDSTSSATAINDRGEIVGNSSTGSSPEAVIHAFYYRDGFMRSLNSKPCNAVAINDAGQIVGNLLTYSTNIFTNIFLPPIPITNIPVHPIYPITNIIGANLLTNILTQSANFAANTAELAFPTNGQIETNIYVNTQPVLFRPGLPPDLFEGTNNVGSALGINNQGEIVGGAYLPSSASSVTQYAFVYKNGLTMDLPELSSNNDFSVASAINNHGDIVGYGFVGLGPLIFEHPFLYSQGLMQDLGTLGGSIGLATAINDVGEITGFSTTISNAEEHAFFYRQGQMIDLGGLPGAQFLISTNLRPILPIKLVSVASAINNWGQIVGRATATNGAIHAFLYHDGTMIDLNDLVRLTHVNGGPGFLALVEANGINDWGQIVGAGTFWDGRHETGRAFLLELPPELLPRKDDVPLP